MKIHRTPSSRFGFEECSCDQTTRYWSQVTRRFIDVHFCLNPRVFGSFYTETATTPECLSAPRRLIDFGEWNRLEVRQLNTEKMAKTSVEGTFTHHDESTSSRMNDPWGQSSLWETTQVTFLHPQHPPFIPRIPNPDPKIERRNHVQYKDR